MVIVIFVCVVLILVVVSVWCFRCWSSYSRSNCCDLLLVLLFGGLVFRYIWWIII